MWFVQDGKKKTRSSLEPHQSSESQTWFARCDGPRLHYGSVAHPAGFRTVSGTLARLACCCCAVPVLVLFDRSTLSPAVMTCGCHEDYEALITSGGVAYSVPRVMTRVVVYL